MTEQATATKRFEHKPLLKAFNNEFFASGAAANFSKRNGYGEATPVCMMNVAPTLVDKFMNPLKEKFGLTGNYVEKKMSRWEAVGAKIHAKFNPLADANFMSMMEFGAVNRNGNLAVAGAISGPQGKAIGVAGTHIGNPMGRAQDAAKANTKTIHSESDFHQQFAKASNDNVAGAGRPAAHRAASHVVSETPSWAKNAANGPALGGMAA